MSFFLNQRKDNDSKAHTDALTYTNGSTAMLALSCEALTRLAFLVLLQWNRPLVGASGLHPKECFTEHIHIHWLFALFSLQFPVLLMCLFHIHLASSFSLPTALLAVGRGERHSRPEQRKSLNDHRRDYWWRKLHYVLYGKKNTHYLSFIIFMSSFCISYVKLHMIYVRCGGVFESVKVSIHPPNGQLFSNVIGLRWSLIFMVVLIKPTDKACVPWEVRGKKKLGWPLLTGCSVSLCDTDGERFFTKRATRSHS